MDFTGKLTNILPAMSGTSMRTGNPWMSQEFVVRTEEQYPKALCFKIFGADRLQQLAPLLQLNAVITVHFDTDVREYNGRFYNEVKAYNITVPSQQPATVPAASAAVAAPAAQPAPSNPFPPSAPAPAPAPAASPAGQDSGQAESDDLPF